MGFCHLFTLIANSRGGKQIASLASVLEPKTGSNATNHNSLSLPRALFSFNRSRVRPGARGI